MQIASPALSSKILINNDDERPPQGRAWKLPVPGGVCMDGFPMGLASSPRVRVLGLGVGPSSSRRGTHCGCRGT